MTKVISAIENLVRNHDFLHPMKFLPNHNFGNSTIFSCCDITKGNSCKRPNTAKRNSGFFQNYGELRVPKALSVLKNKVRNHDLLHPTKSRPHHDFRN